MSHPSTFAPVPQWRPWETEFSSARTYENPFQDARLDLVLTAPVGKRHRMDGFWDGGRTWRARFMPNEIGTWSYETICSDATNAGLHGQRGSFECTESLNETRFDRHGAIRVSDTHRYLEYADGTPFFWLADTVWNGPMLSDEHEWKLYVETRAAQKFSAAQWVATQFIAAPDGDRDGQLAFTGVERIAVNPSFFQRLDKKQDALNRAGILSVPVLLWAASWSPVAAHNNVNPGIALPQDQLILLARYMAARWGGGHVLWILNGDGIYQGEAAERWRAIGRAVFGEREHAPVSLHPGGHRWDFDEFKTEAWLDVWGYQSSHGVDEAAWDWILHGGPATDWDQEPIHPIINLEPPYEYHNDMSHGGTRRISAQDVRHGLYASLLVTPTAGVTYGGHGVWGWDDGSTTPTAHPATGIPKPWREALHMPGAEQVAHLSALFHSIEWWRLRPAPELVIGSGTQAGQALVAAISNAGDLAVIYSPSPRHLELNLSALDETLRAQWFNPLNGERFAAASTGTREHARFETPHEGDWVLLLDKHRQYQ